MGQKPDQRIEHVGRSEQRTVAEMNAVPQMKGIYSAILGDLPGFGKRRDNLNIGLSVTLHFDQTVKHIGRDRIVNGCTLKIHGIRFVFD